MVNEYFARGGKTQPPGAALEQLDSQIGFKPEDLTVDCRRGDIQLLRRGPDGARAHNLVKIAEQAAVKLHE